MTRTHARDRGEMSLGLKVRVKTHGRTDETIALRPVLTQVGGRATGTFIARLSNFHCGRGPSVTHWPEAAVNINQHGAFYRATPSWRGCCL